MKKFFAILIIFLTGCAALPIEDELLPPMFDAPAEVQWQTVTVHSGDVISEIVFAPIIAIEQRETLRFSTAELYIEGVFVANGDEVRAGQIIAELDDPDLIEEMEDARRTAARLALDLEQLDARHAFALYNAANTGVPVDDQSYIDARESLLSQIYFHAQEYAYLAERDEARFVRAEFDGVVQNVMPFAEGLVTSANAQGVINPIVAILEDPERVFFRARQTTDREAAAADYIRPGDRFEMTLTGRAIILEVEVVDPEEYGLGSDDHFWFRVVGGEVLFFEQGTVGRVVHVIEEVRDTIVVPSRALRYVEGREFLFVLEDGVRRLRPVEVGIRGREYTEILRGLELGEQVIL